jgi:hypothetical protein
MFFWTEPGFKLIKPHTATSTDIGHAGDTSLQKSINIFNVAERVVIKELSSYLKNQGKSE